MRNHGTIQLYDSVNGTWDIYPVQHPAKLAIEQRNAKVKEIISTDRLIRSHQQLALECPSNSAICKEKISELQKRRREDLIELEERNARVSRFLSYK